MGAGGSLAAVAYGAPLHVSGAYPPDLYVPNKVTLRRAIQLLGTARSHEDRAGTLRLAPVSAVCSGRVDGKPNGHRVWPLVHPLSWPWTWHRIPVEVPKRSRHGTPRKAGTVSGRQESPARGRRARCALRALPPLPGATDLDTVSRLQHGQTGQLQLLVAAGATLSGPSGVRLPTALGPAQIDVLQVTDADFDPPTVDALVAQPVAAGLQ